MTDLQLYLSVGLPVLVSLAGIVMNIVFFLYLAGRIDRTDERITTRIDVLTTKVVDVDNRVIRLEERLAR